MDKIELINVAKRFSAEWILKNVNVDLLKGHLYAIKGSNGSGKSTLSKIISGYLSPSLGQVKYHNKEDLIDRDDVYQYTAIWSPHSSLLQHMSISEMIEFYFTFKKSKKPLTTNDIYRKGELRVEGSRAIKTLSSGQSQRLGLTLSILSNSSLLVLDEPGSYLDRDSHKWMIKLLQDNTQDRIVIIASNNPDDLVLCDKIINVENFK